MNLFGPLSPDELRAFSELWDRRLPNCSPLGWQLRCDLGERWIRFHSLPESKRYAESELEYAILLGRHETLLAELSAVATPCPLIVVTVCWSSDGLPAVRPAAAGPNARLWRSGIAEPDDPEASRFHAFVDRLALPSEELATLLRKVADDETGEVVITDMHLNWLYAPYDGGSDVFPETAERRDELRSRHSAWLSAHPKGL